MTTELVSVFSDRMPIKGKYVAGRQVSRWDAESDNVDIQYRHLDNPASPGLVEFFSGRKGNVLKVLLLVVCFFVGLIIGYVIRRNIHEKYIAPLNTPTPTPIPRIYQDYDPSIRQSLQDDLQDIVNIEDHIKIWTSSIGLAAVGSTLKVVMGTHDMWQYFPQDGLSWTNYTVLLSYPFLQSPNRTTITLEQPDGTTIWNASFNLSSEHPEQMPFNAYSPEASVKGKLVFANFGRKTDFRTLDRLGVSINNSVLLIKYGRIHPANKVKHAEENGAAGVILYPDPLDFANNNTEAVYPSTWWLPGWAVHSHHVRYTLMGDPQSPGYPSLDGVYQQPNPKENCLGCPSIPVQSVSYNDARSLIRSMNGSAVPDDWIGGLGVPYKTGPGHTDERLVNLTVIRDLVPRKISNLVAEIKGRYEKDRFIIIGAHIDSWNRGGVDSASGYAVLWELLRTFSFHTDKGYRPRRTLKFALWDASKYGHVGSFEWVQEMEKEIGSGAIAYINLDTVVRGNYTFFAESSPLLYDVIRQAASTVKCSDPDYQDKSVLERWTKTYRDPDNPSQPKIEGLQGDSDHSPFYYYLGVPSLSPAYTYNPKKYPNLPSYPAFNTLEDTKDYLTNFTDRNNYTLHVKVTQIVADVILRLSDSALIPFNVQNIANLLITGKNKLKNMEINSTYVNLGFLFSEIDKFSDRARLLQTNLTHLDKSKLYEEVIYDINDKLIQLPRIFIVNRGLPEFPQYRNVLVAPHPENLYKTQIFPGVIWGFDRGRTTGDWSRMRTQVSLLAVAVRQASYNLQSILTVINSLS
ncbi:putative N-acetylated-alpha-linked acidic dipeptidase isoform X1 [Saccostrea echinata]|uniref:putative N-acetylated-alpha-linked acidic dipeptidase isoform X1 n=2 Tax=Saccostrea echinata TaxID=191078 RepID=UPI002A80F10E|nr:putative N-acetylated-alpha-linked acidic dipeptidase isoform X1 [Saccostrea echinata]